MSCSVNCASVRQTASCHANPHLCPFTVAGGRCTERAECYPQNYVSLPSFLIVICAKADCRVKYMVAFVQLHTMRRCITSARIKENQGPRRDIVVRHENVVIESNKGNGKKCARTLDRKQQSLTALDAASPTLGSQNFPRFRHRTPAPTSTLHWENLPLLLFPLSQTRLMPLRSC
jgi:hypothetical protein